MKNIITEDSLKELAAAIEHFKKAEFDGIETYFQKKILQKNRIKVNCLRCPNWKNGMLETAKRAEACFEVWSKKLLNETSKGELPSGFIEVEAPEKEEAPEDDDSEEETKEEITEEPKETDANVNTTNIIPSEGKKVKK